MIKLYLAFLSIILFNFFSMRSMFAPQTHFMVNVEHLFMYPTLYNTVGLTFWLPRNIIPLVLIAIIMFYQTLVETANRMSLFSMLLQRVGIKGYCQRLFRSTILTLAKVFVVFHASLYTFFLIAYAIQQKSVGWEDVITLELNLVVLYGLFLLLLLVGNLFKKKFDKAAWILIMLIVCLIAISMDHMWGITTITYSKNWSALIRNLLLYGFASLGTIVALYLQLKSGKERV